MRSATLPNALSSTPHERRLWLLKALGAGAIALVVGFSIGGAAIGPVLSDNQQDNAEALQARFERRTVDPQGHYPNPFAYRAATPDFGPNRGPALGAYARQQARGRNPAPSVAGVPRLSTEAADAYGASAPPVRHYRAYDRHTGTSY